MNSQITEFKPGFFKIILNILFGLFLILFGLIGAAFFYAGIRDGDWWMILGGALFAVALTGWGIMYIIGSFVNYFRVTPEYIEFRNNSTIQKIPRSEIVNISWTLKKRKLNSITFHTIRGEFSFDPEVFSNGDKQKMISIIEQIEPSKEITDKLAELSSMVSGQQNPTQVNSMAHSSVQSTDVDIQSNSDQALYCGECGKLNTDNKFCHSCGAKIEL